MTVQVPTLNWQPWNKDKASYVATVPINFTTDKTWVILVNTNNQSTPDNVTPNFVLIDNIQNDAIVTLDFGPFQISVSQFVRETYAIPPTVQRLIVTGAENATASIQVLFSTERLAPDTDNQLAINQAGGENMELPVKYITASVAQIPSDGAKCLVFKPVADMTYSLLSILGTNFPNGYFMYVQNNSDFKVTILPDGSDTINSVFNNGFPLILYKGSSGLLNCDGTQWFYQGTLTWESAPLALTINTTIVVPHTLGKESSRWSVWLKSQTVNNGYQIGDEVYLGHGAVNTTLSYTYQADATKATTINYIQSTTLPTLLNRSTGASFVSTNANWRTILRSMVQW